MKLLSMFSSRVSALGTRKKTTPFTAAKVETSMSSPFSFLSVKDGKESPISMWAISGTSSASRLVYSNFVGTISVRKWQINTTHNDPAIHRLEKTDISRLRTFLLDDCVSSSSALLFVVGFATVFDFITFGCSVTGCDEIRVERLGADSCPSATAALRGGIIVVICDGW